MNVIKRKVLFAEPYDRDKLLLNNYIPLSCLVHEKACLGKINYFDESLEGGEDWDFILRLAKHYDFLHIPQATCEITRMITGTMTDLHQLAKSLIAENFLRMKHHHAMKQSRHTSQLYTYLAGRVGVFLDMNECQLAIDILESYFDFDPSNGALRRDLAYLYSFTGQIDKGIALLRRPGLSCETGEELLHQREELEEIAKRGAPEKARLLQEDLLARFPTDALGYNNLGALAWMEGKTKKAIALFKLAYGLDPRQIDILKNLTKVHLEMGNREVAFQYCLKALSLNAKDEEVLDMKNHLMSREEAGGEPSTKQGMWAIG